MKRLRAKCNRDQRADYGSGDDFTINELREAVLARTGAIATAYERADSFIQDMVAKGKIIVEDGKVLSGELKRDMEEKTTETTNEVIAKLDNMDPLIKEDFRVMSEEASKPTLGEMNKLKERIIALEAKLNEEETQAIK